MFWFGKLKEFTKVAFNKRNILAISGFAAIFKSVPLTWILWDSILSIKLYKNQSKREHAIRFLRLGVGIGWFIGFLNPITTGILLVMDGFYSIFRYRQLNVTKHFFEDIPRLARIGVGIMIMPVIPFAIPFF